MSCIGEDLPTIQQELDEIYAEDGLVSWVLNEEASREWIEDFREDQSRHPAVERINIPILYESTLAFDQFRIGAARGTEMPMMIVIDKQGVVRLRTDWIHFDNTIDLIEELLYE